MGSVLSTLCGMISSLGAAGGGFWEAGNALPPLFCCFVLIFTCVTLGWPTFGPRKSPRPPEGGGGRTNPSGVSVPALSRFFWRLLGYILSAVGRLCFSGQNWTSPSKPETVSSQGGQGLISGALPPHAPVAPRRRVVTFPSPMFCAGEGASLFTGFSEVVVEANTPFDLTFVEGEGNFSSTTFSPRGGGGVFGSVPRPPSRRSEW